MKTCQHAATIVAMWLVLACTAPVWGQATARPAILNVRLQADAELEITGKKIAGTGEVRRIQSTPLESGKRYAWSLRATWTEDGKQQSAEKYVELFPGAVLDVTLTASGDVSAEVREVLERVNQERAAAGAPPLTLDPVLCQVAASHSANMARQNTLSHDLDGKTFWQRIGEAGYPQSASGENCAEGAATAADAMQMWMQSPPHRGNMLNAAFREVGIGTATSATGVKYWTQVFATRPPAANTR